MQTRLHIQLDTPSDRLDGITITAAGCFTTLQQYSRILNAAHSVLDSFDPPKPWPRKTAQSYNKEPETP